MSYNQSPGSTDPINPIQILPSGVSIDTKEWLVKDITAMGSKRSDNLENMMDHCILAEDDRGIYKKAGMEVGKPIRSIEMMIGDRLAVLMLQRIFTHWRTVGANLGFQFQCEIVRCREDNPKFIPWGIDLRRLLLSEDDFRKAVFLKVGEDLKEYEHLPVVVNKSTAIIWKDRFGSDPIMLGTEDEIDETIFFQPMSEDMIEGWLNGNQFSYDDPVSGKKLKWRILTGKDESEMLKHSKDPEKAAKAALNARIIEVDGVDYVNKPKWIANWGAGGQDAFRDHVRDCEPGVFTDVEVVCPRCGHHQDVSFPLEESFFSPSLRKKKRGKISSILSSSNPDNQ